MVEMEVVGVAPEPNSNKPLVWLKDKDQKVFLPISIGNFEATAIYMELYDEPPPRPICYDLVRMVLSEMQAAVDQILIVDRMGPRPGENHKSRSRINNTKGCKNHCTQRPFGKFSKFQVTQTGLITRLQDQF